MLPEYVRCVNPDCWKIQYLNEILRTLPRSDIYCQFCGYYLDGTKPAWLDDKIASEKGNWRDFACRFQSVSQKIAHPRPKS